MFFTPPRQLGMTAPGLRAARKILTPPDGRPAVSTNSADPAGTGETGHVDAAAQLGLPQPASLTPADEAASFQLPETPPASPWTLAERTRTMTSSVIRDLLKLIEQPGIISFAGGLPSPETFPVEAFARACSRVLASEHAIGALQYSATEGLPLLRQWVAASLPWPVDPMQVLITTGSQQALDLVAKILIDPGSKVLVETPTYLGALQAFQPMEPAVVCVDSDDSGMLAADLAAKIAGARFVYLLPNFQNPTGRSMSEARRMALSDIAARAGVPILEDNPYGELWFDAPPPLPLAARHPENTLYMGSFSKVLAPGLRLGFLVAPPALHRHLVRAKQAADLHSASFNQRLVCEVLRDGFLDRHVPAIRALYKSKRDTMLAALEREMAGLDVRWNRPAGGMFLWLRLPVGVSATEMLPKAVSRGVAYVPGRAFYAGRADDRTLRLSFATAAPEQLEAGVAALAATVREALTQHPVAH